MKTINKLHRIGIIGLFLCLVCLVGCHDDQDAPGLAPGEGEVVFGFVKIKTYEVSDLKDISSIKIILEMDGKRMELPSLKMNGKADSLVAEPVRLEQGDYKIVSYKIFAADASLLGEVMLVKDNSLTVEAGQKGLFYFPMDVKVIYVNNTIKNVLLGMCRDIFGEDKELWPWKEEDNLADWKNLEFALNDDESIAYLSTIIFDQKFAPMKKLPEGLSSLATLEHILIRDIDLEELSEDLSMTNITSLVLINTKLKKFPKNFFNLGLLGLCVVNCELSELPAEIGNLSDLNLLEIAGSRLTGLPVELGKLTKLQSLRIANAQLTSLPDVFGTLNKLSRLEVDGNPGLSVLPSSIGIAKGLRGIVLNGCGFTSIPDVLKQCAGLRGLNMVGNKLTSVTVENFKGMESIDDIRLDGNTLKNFPALNIPTLIGLSLNNCGLTAFPDLSGYPKLGILELKGNALTALPEGCFVGNPKLTQFYLGGNAPLASLPTNMGIALDVNGKPSQLSFVDVSQCPALHWEVPGTWCCMEVQSKEDFLAHNPNYTGGDVIIRRVNVDRDGSPFVTRKPCTNCGTTK